MVSPSTSSWRVETPRTDAGQVPICASEKGDALAAQTRSRGLDLLLKPSLILRLFAAAYSAWSKDKVPRMSAALAYYTIFSLAPLLLIAIAIAGVVFGAQAAHGQITGQIEGLIGQDGARAVQSMIQSARKPAHSAIAGVIGILALLAGASGVFSEMQDALNTIWHANPDTQGGIREIIKARLLSFGMVLGIGFLLLVSLLFSAALAALAKYLGAFVSTPAVFLHFCDFLFSLLFITLLFAMTFKLLPNVKIAWSDVWAGALLTSLLFTLGKFLLGFYIGRSVSASAYGASGSLVIVVAWIYYSALLLYFGAEFTRVYANKLGSLALNPNPKLFKGNRP
jgi:membrane protein